jgi:hypothetical protein
LAADEDVWWRVRFYVKWAAEELFARTMVSSKQSSTQHAADSVLNTTIIIANVILTPAPPVSCRTFTGAGLLPSPEGGVVAEQ